jgi:hypothetical protein
MLEDSEELRELGVASPMLETLLPGLALLLLEGVADARLVRLAEVALGPKVIVEVRFVSVSTEPSKHAAKASSVISEGPSSRSKKQSWSS